MTPFTIRQLGRPGDIGWIVGRHGTVYAEQFGWDTSFEALVARMVGDFVERHDPERERAWIAEVGGERAGCVICAARSSTVAQLRSLLVDPRARGLGIGGRLVSACIEFARAAGYTELTLWTDDVLVAARRLYEAAGFRLVSEERHHAFGQDLVGQSWSLALT